ncbi:hypothetical protein V2J09_019284 [Rumex salicifolius]
MSDLKSSSCFPHAVIVVYLGLSVIDGTIAVLAFWQFIRIHSRTVQLGWTRQKVLHLMIGFCNLGYLLYFVLTLTATCEGWKCWANSCGFVFMAFPEIVFLAAFLLLIDICHQNDEDEDDDECSSREAFLENRSDSTAADSRQKCFPVPSIHVGNRQKTVILVALITFVLMILFAVLIWIGMGKNPIDSSTVTRVYVDVFSICILLLGGALACYGVLVYMKMSNVRSERSSTEMWKVIGLATVSVSCFTTSSLVALLSEAPVLYCWRQQYAIGVGTAILALLYYFIGSSVPSAFVLWIMRELPPATMAIKREDSRIVTFIASGTTGVNNPQCWTSIASSQNQVQVSRASPI